MIVYKYLEPARVNDVLEKGLLRFTQPSDFNDPFECSPFIREYGDGSRQEEIVKKAMRDAEESAPRFWLLTKAQQEKWKRVAQKLEKKQIAKHRRSPELIQRLNQAQFLDRASEYFGILSLSIAPHSILMWSHYAMEHTGFCVGFDSTHPFFSYPGKEIFSLREVDYADERHVTNFMGHPGDDLTIFFRKCTVWRYEGEFRVIRPLEERSEIGAAGNHRWPISLFRVPKDALREILIGIRASDEIRAKIKELVKANKEYNGIRVVELRSDVRNYGFETAK